MPVTPTYPGVYIDELPSPVRTITGVPTSIAAFVGRAPRGPEDRPVHITSWADYESAFGGLDADTPMSYAVHQYYLNGGSEAEIVRVVGANGGKATVALAGGATLEAVTSGGWANMLRARVDYDTKEDPATADADRKLYNLTVRVVAGGRQERYINVSIDPKDPRNLANLLTASGLVTAKEGTDTLPAAHEAVPQGADPFEDGHDGAWYVQAAADSGKDADAPTAEAYVGSELDKTGLYQLLKTDIFNLLCLPDLGELPAGSAGEEGEGEESEAVDPAAAAQLILDTALKLCVDRRAMLLVDPPATWTSVETAATGALTPPVTGDNAKNAAIYFPNVLLPDLKQEGTVRPFPPCGVMAGVFARTDVARGVWKAPAGTDASLNGVHELAVKMTDVENGRLNPLGVNCLRQLPVVGPVSWGARTTRGADRLADQWKYVPVRRTALFIEESLYRGTQWVVFEPNDEPLWSSIRLNIGAFMNDLFRQGAFQGRTPKEAYLVKCDRDNNPQNDIDRGIVNILVGFAPLKPAEFVLIHITQLAGQIQV
ncbi:MAG: phage tail sheath family protein [Actinomadura sp.]